MSTATRTGREQYARGMVVAAASSQQREPRRASPVSQDKRMSVLAKEGGGVLSLVFGTCACAQAHPGTIGGRARTRVLTGWTACGVANYERGVVIWAWISSGSAAGGEERGGGESTVSRGGWGSPLEASARRLPNPDLYTALLMP